MDEPKIVKCSEMIKTCKYRGHIGGYDKYSDYCDYLGMTGKRRGCNPEKCDKYEKKETGGDRYHKYRKAFDDMDLYRY